MKSNQEAIEKTLKLKLFLKKQCLGYFQKDFAINNWGYMINVQQLQILMHPSIKFVDFKAQQLKLPCFQDIK